MALIICPDCKVRISETAGKCPLCGCQLTPENIAESKRKDHNAQRAFGIGLGTFIFIVGFAAFSGVFDSPESPSTAEGSASSSTASTAPSAPEPAPSPPEPAPDPFSPEKRLVAGKISDWRVADGAERVRAANVFNLIYERTSPPDHELSPLERLAKAIALNQCLMETTKEPAMQEQSVASTAALCLVMMDGR